MSVFSHQMTAIGHFSVLSQTDYNPSIISFVMAMSGTTPLTAAEFTRLWKERGMMERHERFHQRLSSKSGYFLPTTLEGELKEDRHPVEDHLRETVLPVNKTDTLARMKQMQTTQWDLTDQLWRIWIAPWGKLGTSGCFDPEEVEVETEAEQGVEKGESLLFFQGHHALADGASMTAAFLDVVDEAEELRQEIIDFLRLRRQQAKKKARSLWQRFCLMWKKVVWLATGSIRALYHQLSLYIRLLWADDPWNQIRLLAENSYPPVDNTVVDRNLSWSRVAPLEQVKWIAERLGGDGRKLTVNDIFCACITGALARQLDEHRKRIAVLTEDQGNVDVLPTQSHMNIALPVHLKGGIVLPGESVGNNLGGFVVRLPGEMSASPQERLLLVHDELASVKGTPAALLSHILAKTLSYSSRVLPANFIAWMYKRSSAGSIAVVSNNRGLPRHVHLGGRRIEAMHGFVPLPPGIPIGVVVMSYAGNVNLTVTAEPWAVPDSDRFLTWVLDEYMNLLMAAKELA